MSSLQKRYSSRTVKSQRSYGFLITKELIFGFQILDFKDHFSASLKKKIEANKGFSFFVREPANKIRTKSSYCNTVLKE